MIEAIGIRDCCAQRNAILSSNNINPLERSVILVKNTTP